MKCLKACLLSLYEQLCYSVFFLFSVLSFVHIGKCAGTSLNIFLNKNLADYEEIHLRRPLVTQDPDQKYIIWIRDPVERFISAFNHSKSIIDFDIAKLNGQVPSLKNCQAPQKIERKILTGAAFDPDYESLFDDFDDACALAESITSLNPQLKSTALKLMNHPIEHIYKGLGWYLGNGNFIKKAHKSIVKVGCVESMEKDFSELLHLLSLPLGQSLPHIRQNKATDLPLSLTEVAKQNIQDFYRETDYAALREMKNFKFISSSLYDC